MNYNEEMYERKYYDSASERSFWRGYWYYKNGKVISFEKVSDDEYKGRVGSDSGNTYNVSINLNKPRSSSCTCPFAAGNPKICKHMVALYFAVFPDEVIRFDKEIKVCEEEKEKKLLEEERRRKELRKEISRWSKEELINYVVNTMLEDDFDDNNDDCDYYF